MTVTTALTMSGEQFDALPDEEGRHWELLTGELVEMSSASWKHQMIVLAIAANLQTYFRQTANGGAVPDVEFAMDVNIRLRPDVAVLLGEKWRELNAEKTPISGAPDIAIEVISPGETSVQSFRKVRTYLRHGVREVWQVYFTEQSVLIHTARAPIAIVGIEGKLTSELLPGWELPVAEFLDR